MAEAITGEWPSTGALELRTAFVSPACSLSRSTSLRPYPLLGYENFYSHNLNCARKGVQGQAPLGSGRGLVAPHVEAWVSARGLEATRTHEATRRFCGKRMRLSESGRRRDEETLHAAGVGRRPEGLRRPVVRVVR